MKKLQKSGELMWLCGTVFVALGVAICSKANLGVSMIAAPTFVVHDAVAALFPALSVGVVEYILQGIILCILCAAIRKVDWRFLFAFAAAVAYGYVLDLFVWLLGPAPIASYWLQWVCLLAGDCITALGVACFFRTYLPMQVHELFVAQFAKRYNLPINKVKWGYDLSMLAISVILAFTLFRDFDIMALRDGSYHSLGFGTLVTTLINSPIIALWGKCLEKLFGSAPAMPKVYRFFTK